MDDDNYTDDEQNPVEDKKPNWRRELEAKARRADELEAKLQQMERREAFREAGLDLSKPGVGYFLKGYDGELTTDAIKEAAIEAGFLAADTGSPPPTDQPQHPAQQTLDAITEAGSPPSQTGVDFRAEAEKAYDEGGMEAMLDVVQKFGVPVTTRQ